VSGRFVGVAIVAAVIGEVVVALLGRAGSELVVVFGGDLFTKLQEGIAEFGVQVGAADGDLPADVGRSNFGGDPVGDLIVVFGDLPVALLVFDDVLRGAIGNPNCNFELKSYSDLSDGDVRVGGVTFLHAAADVGVGDVVGVALSFFALAERWHISGRRGRVERALGEKDWAFFYDWCKLGGVYRRRGSSPRQPACQHGNQKRKKKPSSPHGKDTLRLYFQRATAALAMSIVDKLAAKGIPLRRRSGHHSVYE
jgi:hypothetical protein